MKSRCSVVPTNPTQVWIDNVTESQVSVHWNEPEHPYGLITNYLVTWSFNRFEIGSGKILDIVQNESLVPGNQTSLPIDQLFACTTYTFTVSAATSAGRGAQTEASNTTLATSKCLPCLPILSICW